MAQLDDSSPRLMDARVATTTPIVRWYLTNERLILGLVGFVGFFAIWELASRSGVISDFLFPPPSTIAHAGFREFQNPRLWNDLRLSGIELSTGYTAAALVAVPLGLCAGWYTRFSYFVDPWFMFLNALPRIAFLPLIVLWVGIGIEAKAVVIFLAAFFPIAINTMYSVRTADRSLLQVAQSYGASQVRVFTTVVFPGSLPFIIAGLRLAIGRALIAVVIAELFAANGGIGHMIVVATRTLQMERALFGVLLLTAMGVILVELVRVVEKRLQQWRPKVGSAQ